MYKQLPGTHSDPVALSVRVFGDAVFAPEAQLSGQDVGYEPTGSQVSLKWSIFSWLKHTVLELQNRQPQVVIGDLVGLHWFRHHQK